MSINCTCGTASRRMSSDRPATTWRWRGGRAQSNCSHKLQSQRLASSDRCPERRVCVFSRGRREPAAGRERVSFVVPSFNSRQSCYPSMGGREMDDGCCPLSIAKTRYRPGGQRQIADLRPRPSLSPSLKRSGVPHRPAAAMAASLLLERIMGKGNPSSGFQLPTVKCAVPPPPARCRFGAPQCRTNPRRNRE